MKLALCIFIIAITAIISAFVGMGIGFYWQNEGARQYKESTMEVMKTLISVKEMGVLNMAPYNEFWRSVTYYEILSEVPTEEAIPVLKDSLLIDIKEHHADVQLLCSKLSDPNYQSRCEQTLERANVILSNNAGS